MQRPNFDLQGHRGARGLLPENTLPSFEAALDAGVSAIETDLHLTRDGVLVLHHDAEISERICRRVGTGAPDPSQRPRISALSVEQLRAYRADRNPDPARFPEQTSASTPLAGLFAPSRGMDPYAIPTLEDFVEFVAAYGGKLGTEAGKSRKQQDRARRMRFELEIKRIPFETEAVDIEAVLVRSVQTANIVQRTIVRSFDHRCVRKVKEIEQGLQTAVLVSNITPVAPVDLVRQALADIYCPDYLFTDEALLRQCQAANVPVVPWTVNDESAWETLIGWGAAGITTDYPDRLATWLAQHNILVW